MTARERLKAWEKKEKKYYQSNGLCYICRKPVSLNNCQFAHKIASTKANYSKYGKYVIDHIDNGEITCSDKFGRCNDGVNIGGKPLEAEALVKEIGEEK